MGFFNIFGKKEKEQRGVITSIYDIRKGDILTLTPNLLNGLSETSFIINDVLTISNSEREYTRLVSSTPKLGVVHIDLGKFENKDCFYISREIERHKVLHIFNDVAFAKIFDEGYSSNLEVIRLPEEFTDWIIDGDSFSEVIDCTKLQIGYFDYRFDEPKKKSKIIECDYYQLESNLKGKKHVLDIEVYDNDVTKVFITMELASNNYDMILPASV